VSGKAGGEGDEKACKSGERTTFIASFLAVVAVGNALIGCSFRRKTTDTATHLATSIRQSPTKVRLANQGPPQLPRPPQYDACRLHSASRPAGFGPAEVSPVRFPCMVPCDTPVPTPKATMATDRPAPTLCARRLRDADESDPHFRPRRLCPHLRRARSDQDDQPAAGHAGARWPLHPLLLLLHRHLAHRSRRRRLTLALTL